MIGSRVARSSSGKVLIGRRQQLRKIRCDFNRVGNSYRSRQNVLARCSAGSARGGRTIMTQETPISGPLAIPVARRSKTLSERSMRKSAL